MEAMVSCIIRTLTFIIKFIFFFNLNSQIRYSICPCRKKKGTILLYINFTKIQYYKLLFELGKDLKFLMS